MRLYSFFFQSLLWRSIYLISLFLLNLFIARQFGAIGSGWIFYITNLYAFFLLVFSFSMESSISYYLAGGKINEKESFLISVSWTLIISLIAFFALGYNFSGLNKEFSEKQFLLISLAFISGNLLITFFVPLFYAKKDFLWPNIILALVNAILITTGLMIGNVFTWLTTEIYLQFYFYSFLFSGVILSIFFYFKYHYKSQLGLPSGKQWSLLFRYSSLSFIANVITFLLFRVDYWFVNKYCDETALGNYIQVSKLSQLFFAVPAILASTVFPMTAGGFKEEVRDSIQPLSRGVFLIFGIIALVIALAGKWLFPYLFGESFDAMYLLFILLIPGVLIICMIYPVTAYYAGKNRIWVNIKGCGIALCVLIAGDMILVPAYGVNAAALVCSLSYLVYGLFMLFKFRSDYKVPVINFISIRKSDLIFLGKMLKIRQANGVQ